MTEDYKDYKLRGKIHAPFGPPLLEFKIPEPYVSMLNTYGDKISSSDEKSKQLDWSNNLVGNVKQEHKIEDHIWYEKPNKNLPSLFNWAGNCVSMYIKTHLSNGDKDDVEMSKKPIKSIKLHNSWLVNSIAGDFNPPHMHSGMLSIAGWLKVPKSIEEDKEREQAGWIEFLFADPHPFVNPKYPIKPEVGKIMVFPSWLQHQVYPFRGKGIRRSISFNMSYNF
jgi:hypothetical protein